jgi:hypothetical protein
MALTKFVRNVEDISDDGGYKFRFRCDQCSDGYESQYVSSSANLLKTALDVFSIFTHRLSYGARSAAQSIDRGLRGKERDAAYETAVHEAMTHFKKCSACGKWVCPEHCWNERAGLCEACAPDAKEAAGRRAAAMQVDEAVQRTAAGEAVGTVTCPSCGTQLRGAAKFCESCGCAVGQRKCRHCQADIGGSARFCGACGGAQA